MAKNIFELMSGQFDSLAEAVVARMRELGPDSKTSPDEGAYAVLKDPWEEYVLQVQEEESYAFEAYQQQIGLFCWQEAEELDFHSLVQLWCATSEAIMFDGDAISRGEMIEPVSKMIFEEVQRLAGDAEIPHYWAEVERLEAEAEALDSEEENEDSSTEDEGENHESQDAEGESDEPSSQLALF